MRALGAIITALLLSALLCQPACAGKRVALVIGNSAYKNVPRLTNPVNDAALVTEMFKKAGFDSVTTRLDANIVEMRKALREFGAQARDADIAVIYYAGHGIELDGNNYLIPTDATLETDTDVLDETFPLDRVLFAVEPARQLRLVILDACRDNPFAKTMKRTVASRGIGRGLAKIEPNNPNTMIAFAAKAGSTASDGDAKDSPFAVALVNHLAEPGLDLRKAFGYVRDEVLKNTGNQQEPYVYGSLGGEDLSLVPAKPAAKSAVASPDEPVRRDYELALQLATRDGWNAFLGHYHDGYYAELAKGQLNKIAAEEARAAAAEKARVAEQEKARLVADGAKKAEQVKAAAEAKAAEDARVAAEVVKKLELEKVAAAEQARVAAERQKAIDDAKAAEEAKATAKAKAEQAARAASAGGTVDDTAARAPTSDKPVGPVASLTPPSQPDQAAGAPASADIPRQLQVELRRVGCNTSAVDGNWNTAAQRSLTLFNKHAGLSLDVKVASLSALDAVKSRAARVCPLVCDHGYKADGDTCVRITCKSGYRVGDDNSCEKIESRKPVANRELPANQDRPEGDKAKPAAKQQAQSSGQILCNQTGCRPIAKGCHLAGRGFNYVGTGASSQVAAHEVCP
jgi:uncharacterized caspase-like protein